MVRCHDSDAMMQHCCNDLLEPQEMYGQIDRCLNSVPGLGGALVNCQDWWWGTNGKLINEYITINMNGMWTNPDNIHLKQDIIASSISMWYHAGTKKASPWLSVCVYVVLMWCEGSILQVLSITLTRFSGGCKLRGVNWICIAQLMKFAARSVCLMICSTNIDGLWCQRQVARPWILHSTVFCGM